MCICTIQSDEVKMVTSAVRLILTDGACVFTATHIRAETTAKS
jgi:hypothetical protein